MSAFIEAFAQQLQQPTHATGLAALTTFPLDLRVYRNTIALAQREALRANYPTLTSLLGEDYVDALGLRYAQECPNDQVSLLHYGHRLPAWLHAHSADAALDLPPYAAAVAKLDRAWTQSHCAADAKAIEAAEMAGLMQQNTALQSHPAAFSFYFDDMPAAQLFVQSRAGVTDFSSLAWQGGGVLISRPQQHVQISGCSVLAHRLLLSFRTPRSLDEVLSQAKSAQDMGAALFELVAQGALMVTPPP